MMSNVITLKDNNGNLLCEEDGITLYFFLSCISVLIWVYKHISTDGVQVYHTGYTL